MREKILFDLNKAIIDYDELEHYLEFIPENLLDGAKTEIQNDIPYACNEILSLLNSVSEKQLFKNQNSIRELIELFTNLSVDLDRAFELVKNNKNIIGWDGSKDYSADHLLKYQYLWLHANCDALNTILVFAKKDAQGRKNSETLK